MKRILLIAAAIAFLWAGAGWAQIANTAHDLSSGGTGDDIKGVSNEVCVYCHTPHNATYQKGPLWNHTATTQNIVWNITTTVRGTTLPTDITSAALAPSSACLSCHDGSVALGSVLNYQGAAADLNVTGTNVSSGKLTSGSGAFLNTASEYAKNHPLGVSKPASSAGFTDFNTLTTADAVNYRNPLVTGYVACGSCHNPHITTNSPYLRISNSGSAICTTCHDA